jgi:hypothetical protein
MGIFKKESLPPAEVFPIVREPLINSALPAAQGCDAIFKRVSD